MTALPERLDFTQHFAPESGLIQRARETECAVAPVDDTGPFILAFEDSDHIHEVTLYRDGEAWHGNCWALDDHGNRKQQCKGLTYNEGLCAHLWRVQSDAALGDVDVADAEEERVQGHVERLSADGGEYRPGRVERHRVLERARRAP